MRVMTVELVLTLAERTSPSSLGKTSMTRASGHCPLGKFLSANRTTSPTFRFPLVRSISFIPEGLGDIH